MEITLLQIIKVDTYLQCSVELSVKRTKEMVDGNDAKDAL